MYGVTLQDTGARNFVVAGLGPIDALNPRVIALRILTTPLPIAVIVVSSAASCTIAFDQPTFVQNGNNIDIRIKERLPDERVRSIALCAGQPPTAEAVHLVGVSNPMAHTYSVNGVAIAPTFSF